MITVPASLKTEIEKLRGRRLQARCRIDYSDANIDNTITATASSVELNTYLDQVYNGKEDVSAQWASLDGSWVLGVHALAPETEAEKAEYEIGWWSEDVSLADKTFYEGHAPMYGEVLYGSTLYEAPTVYPTLVVNFTPRTLSSVRVSFDNARMEYAEDFDILFYDSSLALLDSISVTGNTGVKYVTTISAINQVCEMRLIIKKWSEAGRQAKVAEMYTSIYEMYNGSDIMELDVIENRELAGVIPLGTTASGKCTLKLYNRNRKFDYDNVSSNLYGVVRAGVRISPEIGDGTSWIPLGVFYATDWDISKREITATVTGLDRMAQLGESDYITNTIIQAPADESFLTDTAAEWNGGSAYGVLVVGDTIRMEY